MVLSSQALDYYEKTKNNKDQDLPLIFTTYHRYKSLYKQSSRSRGTKQDILISTTSSFLFPVFEHLKRIQVTSPFYESLSTEIYPRYAAKG